MSKPKKYSQIWLLLKIPNICEICIIYRLLKNRKIVKNSKGFRATLSSDARARKELISHLSTRINLI